MLSITVVAFELFNIDVNDITLLHRIFVVEKNHRSSLLVVTSLALSTKLSVSKRLSISLLKKLFVDEIINFSVKESVCG